MGIIKDIKAYCKGLKRATGKAHAQDQAKSYEFPVQPPVLAPGVVPEGFTAPVMAMDYSSAYSLAQSAYPGGGFPGYPYLSQLATRAEFRAAASAMSTELTREWIEFSSSNDDAQHGDKLKAIEEEFKRLGVRETFRRACEHDCHFGKGHIFIDINSAVRGAPLILDPRTVKKGSLNRIVPIEPIWTTPSAYNAIDPAAPDFYRPSKWFMLGQEVHATRLLTVVTRELPDILKPAFNFGGMSLSQLAQPYVDNWLRTRQSVSDLIDKFSIVALKTAMAGLLQGDDDGTGLIDRAKLFTATRSNQGLMLLDKENEELVQLNTPLSGLHELQAQAQEQQCSVMHIPAVILTGIAPSGFGNVAEGEIRTFYDWIMAQAEAYWHEPLEIILKVVQLHLFGEIDPDIKFSFVPLYQMTPAELADIRLKDSQAATAYIGAGVIDPQEERERLASDPESGYHGLDVTKEIVAPNAGLLGEEDPALEAERGQVKRELLKSAMGQDATGDGEQTWLKK